jgi:mevalonate kinase
MDVTGRRAAPSDQIQVLVDANTVLQANITQLERENADLNAVKDRLEQKIKSLQVGVTILLATTAGLGVGLGASLAGAAVSTALAYATAAVFGVITASIAILTFMRK